MVIVLTKVFTCLFFLVGFINCQDEDLKKGVCGINFDCKSCLTKADYCAWCDNYGFNLKHPGSQCSDIDSLISLGCPKDNILHANHVIYSDIVNDSMVDFSFDNIDNIKQVKPQKITIEMRPGDTATVNYEYKVAKNYPLDLYYLMDLTLSMKDDKETLVRLEDALKTALWDLTSTIRFGFGSFADKPLMPYANMDEKHKKNPCGSETCLPTYTFAHRLNMTKNVNDFIRVVNDAVVTGNLDNTEAGLDALMQVAVCEDRIGWSSTAHRVVIMTTDGLLHFAGNGKLGGVVRPNDEKCHLDANGDYTDSILYDYPALDQIYRVLLEKKISVIFAVTESRKKYYDQVHTLLPQNTFVGNLESDSSNILNLLKQGYKGLFSSVNFIHNAPDVFKLTFFSDCGTKGPMIETASCNGIKIGDIYNFTVNITLNELPSGGEGAKTTIVISDARQIGKSDLTVNIVSHKICNCNSDTPEASENCPHNSKMLCGSCVCNEGWFGSNCDCQVGQETTFDFQKCRDPNVDQAPYCSNNGDCNCGVCSCDNGYNGKYCECRVCEKSSDNGTECGGVFRGACSCGKCICADGWSGPSCSCQTGIQQCLAAGATVPCSGRGNCVCGMCECDNMNENVKYTGEYCQTCATCNDASCSLYEACARCTLGDETYCIENVCAPRSGTVYTTKLTEDYISESTNASLCHFWVSEVPDSCKYTFTYEVRKDWTVHLTISEVRGACDTIGMASAYLVFGMTLVAGILVIIIVKAIQLCRDKRAYSEFVSEIEISKMKSEVRNPLYKSPITQVRLPEQYDRNKNE